MSNTKYILFLSTTPIWGGSEVLWTQSARLLLKSNYHIRAGLRYPYEIVKNFINPENYVSLRDPIRPPHNLLRIINKFGIRKFPDRNLLDEEFARKRPDLVIISQGNNTEGYHMMQSCIKVNVPFITITHLVTLDFWPALSDQRIKEFIALYQSSLCNYFVSKKSINLHNRMLGQTLANSDVLYNPFIKSIPATHSYPKSNDSLYKVALIGRIESFHKGYDLLIEVLKQAKWRERPIQFSLFGSGPHKELLQRLIDSHNIQNMVIHAHQEDIAEIWKIHQILLMPSRMEGQSLSLIEAMRFSRAIIATDVGGTAELLEDGVTGFLAAYPVPEAIDDALERAWNRRTEWEQLGINAARAIGEKHPKDALGYFTQKLENHLA